MKGLYTFALSVIISGTAFCQQFYKIEVNKLDTLFFYAIKGKACDSVVFSLQDALKEKGEELQSNARVIELQATEIENSDAQVTNLEATIKTNDEGFEIEREGLKTKVKRWIKIAVAEAGVIVIIVVVILLI